MKLKIANVILFLLCVGLGIALFLKQKKTEEVQLTAEVQHTNIVYLSNEVQAASKDLVDQRAVNTDLTNKVVQKETQINQLSITVTQLVTKLDQTEADAKAKEQAAQAELAKRDTRIKELEGMNDDMTKTMGELTNRIAGLGNQIATTERKLAVSEGDREFLLTELKRLQTEKAELERQFNDLKTLKTQVAKLKEELAVARRLDFIRAGVFSGMKGAEALMKKTPPPAAKNPTNFNLNVEFKQEGGTKIIPPPTNTPAPK